MQNKVVSISEVRASRAVINSEAPEAVWIVCLAHPCGGETIYLDEHEAAVFNADPDAYAAWHFGFSSVADYRTWIVSKGTALCSEHTRSGRPCQNPNARSQLEVGEWRQRHRTQPCAIHA